MNTIKVESTITIYERDGEETHDVPPPRMRVLSHWNRQDFVVLECGEDATRVTVAADDLRKAIENARRR